MAKKILVAEADNTVQQVVSYFLNLEGFEVTTARDGVDALEAVERVSPDAIILDPGLTGINGIEVSRLIREKSRFKNVPVLFLANSMDSLSKISADIPPGYGIINKPIDPTKMSNTIKEYLDKAEQAAPEQEESVSIEELLGWEVTEGTEKKKAVEAEESPKVDEISTDIFAAEGTAEAEVLQKGPGGETKKSEGMPRPKEDLSGLYISKNISDDFTVTETSGRVEAELRDRITDEMIERIVSNIAREIIERVTWEIVPKIAEEEIKKEIERLKSEDK